MYPATTSDWVRARAWERCSDTVVDAILVDISYWVWADRPDEMPDGLLDAARADLGKVYAAPASALGVFCPFVTRSPKWLLVSAALVGPAVGFGVYWFAPHKLLIDAKVNEPAPKDMIVLSSGTFQTLEHATSGAAELIVDRHGQNKRLRLLDLRTSNGPELHVYLSSVPAQRDWSVYDDAEYVDLGPLKGNIGTSYYSIPDGVDASKLVSAVVWCKRFSVGFGVATLTPNPPDP